MSVQSACDYAVYLQSSHDDKHVNHHDFALVLTRLVVSNLYGQITQKVQDQNEHFLLYIVIFYSDYLFSNIVYLQHFYLLAPSFNLFVLSLFLFLFLFALFTLKTITEIFEKDIIPGLIFLLDEILVQQVSRLLRGNCVY